jgi:hypothetical protein
MFAEGGHRLNDHLRFRGTQWAIPFKGEPGSIHPTGVVAYWNPVRRYEVLPAADR